jgi:phosphoribosylformimino-5-aminoimidazole carboxamide ribotide isomerase
MEDVDRYVGYQRSVLLSLLYLYECGANDVESVALIERYCSETLIHAADVEGLCQGVDEELVRKLGEWVTLPCTYAGGARGKSQVPTYVVSADQIDISDLGLVDKLSHGKVDLTYGS